MSKKLRSSSAADILGKKAEVKPKLSNLCMICDKPIPIDRIKALQTLNTPVTNYTHTKCSITTKVKGIYLGEVGTSQIMLCDKIYDDSVRSVFRRAEVDTSDEEPENS
jgi:hypothetical protein